MSVGIVPWLSSASSSEPYSSIDGENYHPSCGLIAPKSKVWMTSDLAAILSTTPIEIETCLLLQILFNSLINWSWVAK